MNKKENKRQRSKDKSERIYYFDNLKYILILLVVIGHAVDLITYKSDYAKSVYIFIYLFHMPLFVFISGYFSKNTIKNNNKNKIISYFILFILLTFLYEVLNCIQYKTMNYSLFTVGGISWYLFAMVGWYLISMITKKVNKKYLLILTICLSLIIGYDSSVSDFLVLSRIIVFYPYFLLGQICEEKYIKKIINNKRLKYFSITMLILWGVICLFFIDIVYNIRPILTSRTPYEDLAYFKNFGALLRLLFYLSSIITGIAILSLIPRKKIFFSKFGSRTLAIYFFHYIVLRVIVIIFGLKFRVYQLIILSIIITLLLSLKVFSKPFNLLFKINFFEESNKN